MTTSSSKPTIVLVHGAFADSSSWNGVVARLAERGYPVVSAANPLRSVAGDALYVASIVDSISGPVVLVGHSYGGAVITSAALGKAQVKALVYVAAFAPDEGESAGQLAGKFPGGTLGAALAKPVPLPTGGVDLYIEQSKFWQQFAADVAEPEARLMAAAQRPIAEAALVEASGSPAWKKLPSYFVYGTGDLNIPAAGLGFMAERAGSRKTVVVEGASHVVMSSHPLAVADLIEVAAAAQ
ncbi:MAG TPA: alpha/beta hydrolase [Rhodocyclaceae bacterium]|nr:alpha/beta hydrolase [Rhodocyclaceae bacterium]